MDKAETLQKLHKNGIKNHRQNRFGITTRKIKKCVSFMLQGNHQHFEKRIQILHFLKISNFNTHWRIKYNHDRIYLGKIAEVHKIEHENWENIHYPPKVKVQKVKKKKKKKKNRNTPIYFNTNYHRKMKLVPIIMDYWLLQLDALKFFLGVRLYRGLYLTLIVSM